VDPTARPIRSSKDLRRIRMLIQAPSQGRRRASVRAAIHSKPYTADEQRDRSNVVAVDFPALFGKVFPRQQVGMDTVGVVSLCPRPPALLGPRPAPALVLEPREKLDLLVGE